VLPANPDDASTAGVSNANDEERSERAVDRRETADRSNGDRREPREPRAFHTDVSEGCAI